MLKVGSYNLYNISLNTLEYITLDSGYYEIRWKNYILKIDKKSVKNPEYI